MLFHSTQESRDTGYPPYSGPPLPVFPLQLTLDSGIYYGSPKAACAHKILLKSKSVEAVKSDDIKVNSIITNKMQENF